MFWTCRSCMEAGEDRFREEFGRILDDGATRSNETDQRLVINLTPDQPGGHLVHIYVRVLLLASGLVAGEGRHKKGRGSRLLLKKQCLSHELPGREWRVPDGAFGRVRQRANRLDLEIGRGDETERLRVDDIRSAGLDEPLQQRWLSRHIAGFEDGPGERDARIQEIGPGQALLHRAPVKGVKCGASRRDVQTRETPVR